MSGYTILTASIWAGSSEMCLFARCERKKVIDFDFDCQVWASCIP